MWNGTRTMRDVDLFTFDATACIFQNHQTRHIYRDRLRVSQLPEAGWLQSVATEKEN